jgi:hypothetical protein
MIVNTIPHGEEYPDRTWLVCFEHLGASANIAILGDEPTLAYLYMVQSTNPRNGEASALIREIDEYCLSHGISLIVDADPYDAGNDAHIKTHEQLKTWYEKNGAYFVEYDSRGHPQLLLGAWRESQA